MIPTILQLTETLEISTFGLMLGLGFYCAFLLFERELKCSSKDPEIAYKLLIAIIPASIVGAKIFYIFEKIDEFSSNPASVLLSGTGLSFYGGLILSVFVCYFVIKKILKEDFLTLADILSPSLAIGYSIGKFGSHLSGYSYGIETSSFLGTAYPNGFIPTSTGVYPTALFEVFFAFLVFFIIMKIRKNPYKKGTLFVIAVLLNAVPFFLIDFINKSENVFAFFSLNQLLSFIIILVSAVFLFINFKGKTKQA